MPGQAILDLPVLNLEAALADPLQLHRDCLAAYGLTGLQPHADAVFHLAASLWMYRRDETPAMLAGLAAIQLKALTEVAACRRRLHAAGAEGKATQDAEAELEYAEADLHDVTQLALGLVAAQVQDMSGESRAIMDENLDAMAEPAWAPKLEALSQSALELKLSRVDFSAEPRDLLASLGARVESLAAAARQPRPRRTDAGIVNRMRDELREYQAIAGQAGHRLRQVSRERKQLEAQLSDNQARDLHEVMNQAQRRVRKIEAAAARDQARLHAEIIALRAENERLADEALRAVSDSARDENRADALNAQIAELDAFRAEAADAIEKLTARLDETLALAAGQQAEVTRLRHDLDESQRRARTAQATVEALEAGHERSREFEAALTQSEQRLARTEESLVEAQERVNEVERALEDRDYRLGQLEQRAATAKRSADSLAGQLSESETLLRQREARIRDQERELERLRADLGDASARATEATTARDQAREAERAARSELERLHIQLREERSHAETARVDTEKFFNELNSAKRRAEEAEAELQRQRVSLAEAQRIAREAGARAEAEAARAARAVQNTEEAAARLDAARLRAESAEAAAATLGARQDARPEPAELELLRVELTEATAALEEAKALAEARLREAGERLELAELRNQNLRLEREVLARGFGAMATPGEGLKAE